jgi:hypothetical protein
LVQFSGLRSQARQDVTAAKDRLRSAVDELAHRNDINPDDGAISNRLDDLRKITVVWSILNASSNTEAAKPRQKGKGEKQHRQRS